MGLTYTLVKCDRLRIPPAWKERGWNEATTGAAIFAFSPLCIVAHYWVTRRNFRGVLNGLLALVFLLLVQAGLTLLYQEVGLLSLALLVVFLPMVLTVLPWIVVLALV